MIYQLSKPCSAIAGVLPRPDEKKKAEHSVAENDEHENAKRRDEWVWKKKSMKFMGVVSHQKSRCDWKIGSRGPLSSTSE